MYLIPSSKEFRWFSKRHKTKKEWYLIGVRKKKKEWL